MSPLFPPEVWLEVANKIDSVQDLLALASTSKQLNKITHEESIWKRLFFLYKKKDWRYLNPICHYEPSSCDWTEEELEDYSSVAEPDRTMLNDRKSLPILEQFKLFYKPPALQHLQGGEVLQVEIYSRGCWHSANYKWLIKRTQDPSFPYDIVAVRNDEEQTPGQSSNNVFPINTDEATELEAVIWSAMNFIKPSYYSTSRVTVTIIKIKKDGSQIQLATFTSPSHLIFDYLIGYRNVDNK